MNHLKKAKELDLRKDQFVLVGGSILDIHGIRKSDDIDVVVSVAAFEELHARGWEIDVEFQQKWGRKRLVHDAFEVYTDLYYKAYDYYMPLEVLRSVAHEKEDVFVQPLGLLLLGKKDNGRPKDFEDIVLIEKYLLEQ